MTPSELREIAHRHEYGIAISRLLETATQGLYSFLFKPGLGKATRERLLEEGFKVSHTYEGNAQDRVSSTRVDFESN